MLENLKHSKWQWLTPFLLMDKTQTQEVQYNQLTPTMMKSRTKGFLARSFASLKMISIGLMALPCMSLIFLSQVRAESNTENSVDMYSDYAVYENGVLTIPRIDTPEKAGFYQNVSFRYTENGTWELQKFHTAGQHPVNFAVIESVELVKTDSFPIQAFLKVKTGISGCDALGQVSLRQIDNRFEVDLYVQGPDLEPGTFSCIALFTAVEKIIPLPIYALAAGTYEYVVNDGKVGSFELTQENILQE